MIGESPGGHDGIIPDSAAQTSRRRSGLQRGLLALRVRGAEVAEELRLRIRHDDIRALVKALAVGLQAAIEGRELGVLAKGRCIGCSGPSIAVTLMVCALR